MGTVHTYTAYHTTDKSNVTKIVEDNFVYNKKSTHWLGNGVYFFLDKSLAILWGSNCPTKKYGLIKIPAIIEAAVCVNGDSVCDMRELQAYNEVKLAFDTFWKYVHKASGTAKYNKDFDEKLQCAFFNWLTNKWNLKCVICNFQKRKMNILKSATNDIFERFCIAYVETQMCVKDASLITERKEIS